MGRHKREHAARGQYKRMFGRLYLPRVTAAGAEPALIIREGQEIVPIGTMLGLIANQPSATNEEIICLLRCAGLKPSDIDTLRIYGHRFGFDVTSPRNLADCPPPVVLLDENSPTTAVLSLSKSFGWATHVGLENLVGRDTPDEDIWEFAQVHQLGCIVTRDSDFLEIHGRRSESAGQEGAHVPLLVFIKHNLNADVLSGLFVQHSYGLRQYMKSEGTVACALDEQSGLAPLF